MRFAITLLIGLMIGVLGTSSALNALRQAHVLPRSLMVLIDHHQRSVNAELAAPSCSTKAVRHHFARLNTLGADIDTVFATSKDATFLRYAADLQAATSAALHTMATSCAELTLVATRVDDACDACHRDYR